MNIFTFEFCTTERVNGKKFSSIFHNFIRTKPNSNKINIIEKKGVDCTLFINNIAKIKFERKTVTYCAKYIFIILTYFKREFSNLESKRTRSRITFTLSQPGFTIF